MRIDTTSIFLEWDHVPHDTVLMGSPVWLITHLDVRGVDMDEAIEYFENARDRFGVGLVSCRLRHNCLTESMFLESHGFRFIEMLYQPELTLTPGMDVAGDSTLTIRLANDKDLPTVVDMAGRAFVNERFHMDPRLGAALGNKRYQNWVISSFNHPTQLLYVLFEANRLVAFFVTEMQADGVCYWHLNAVAPEAQGLGYGQRAWQAMIGQASDSGAKRIRTSIVARNVRVLNLYARLGFRFPAPLMTFHWVREASS